MATKDELGKHGEQLAVTYLEATGMTIIARNWRCRQGEIDIIAEEGPNLIVVEVKMAPSPAGLAVTISNVNWTGKGLGLAIMNMGTEPFSKSVGAILVIRNGPPNSNDLGCHA